jgi:cytochrome c oxidase accessory protein FixG
MVDFADTIEPIDVEPTNSAEWRKLYAARVKIHPKRAAGFYRNLKWAIMAVTLAIYYLTPWLRWDRGDYAPDQAVLVDLAHRKFYFFFIEIWPQEFYYIAGLLIMAGVGLFLITSTVGRAWCGYTCPQTVWTDLFLVVERWAEGDRNARIRLDGAPWTFDKLRKRLLKHAIWLVTAMATGGAWVFYFADAPSLARALVSGSAAPVAYASVAVLTATTYVFAGFMREQVCTYMCPWPRIQAAMLDEDSLVVTYNAWRGEPRSRHRKRAAADVKLGDCVDCNACVAVCPQGIDIREGQQLECITCALCIDACDQVMAKTGSPKGLISYTTLKTYNDLASGKSAELGWRSFIRPRTVMYSGVWSLIGVLMLYSLVTRDRLDVSVLHDRNPQFVVLTDGAIRNGYTIKILNMLQLPRTFELSLDGLAGATMTMTGSDAAPSRSISLLVDADELRTVKAYVTAPRAGLSEQAEIRFQVRDLKPGGETAFYDSAFIGPGQP